MNAPKFLTIALALGLIGVPIGYAQTLYVPSGTSGIGTSSTGNVGIGTSAPAQKLHLEASGSTWMMVKDTGQSSTAYFGMENGATKIISDGSSIVFRTNGGGWSDKLTMTNAGNVGIGTPSPSSLLTVASNAPNALLVQGNSTNSIGMILNNTSSGGSWSIYHSGSAGPAPAGSLGFFDNQAGVTRLSIALGGNVGIGTTNPTHKLAVNGTVRAKEVIVDTGWADYVFEDSYQLAPLGEVEAYIKTNRRLPGIPSAVEVEQRGISLGDMQCKLLAKLEEVTLHLIRLEKENAAQFTRLERLERENRELRHQLSPSKSNP